MQTIVLTNRVTPSALREPFETLFRLKWALICIVGAILLGGLALAVVIMPKYTATSTILVMPGPDYTVRQLAGTNQSVNQAIDRTQILATEVAILQSRELHRQVLRQIGVAALYPTLLDPPGTLAKAMVAAKAELQKLTGRTDAQDRSPGPDDTVEHALDLFDASFSATASNEGNTIALAFQDKDPAMAARVLSTLQKTYIERRRELFADTQVGSVQQEAQVQRDRVEEAERKLSDFKVAHDISNFPTRQEILAQAQGAAERGLMEAQSDADQQKARVSQLQGLLERTPRDLTAQDSDVDSRLQALRTNLDLLQAKRAELGSQYRANSPVTQNLDAQIATRKAELASSRADRTPSGFHTAANPVYTSISVDMTRAKADLDAATARQSKVTQQIAAVVAQQQALNALEREFGALERQRAQAQQDYAETAKILTERRVIEQVQATKQADIRVLSAVVDPITPAATRRLILIVTFCLACMAGLVIVLLGNYMRRGFLLSDSLERDCGIPVLVTIPELPKLAGGRSGGIRPM